MLTKILSSYLIFFSLYISSVLSSEFDLVNNEILIDYNQDYPIHDFESKEFGLNVKILTKDNFIAGSVSHKNNPKSSEVNHFEIYGVDIEPTQVYFNGEPLYYLNWIYDHERQMINIVNIEHDITQDFIIEWSDELDTNTNELN
jgi:hypothetical protein